jgi:diguanylate cyclase (GGDEF)-like protein
MHPLLERQLAKARGADGQLDLPRLAGLVSAAYTDFERDRGRTDRSIALMVEENERLTSELQASLHQFATQNARFEAALGNIHDGLTMFDADHRLVVANARFQEIYGIAPEAALPGARLTEMFKHSLAERMLRFPHGPDGGVLAALATAQHGTPTHLEWELADARVIDIALTTIKGGGWVALHRDVTDQRAAQKQIFHMARHDALTDLPNRVLFREAMRQLLPQTSAEAPMAVLCLDLDHFKAVNDTLGHPVGDRLLCRVAERLRECVRGGDMVVRLGGDEFAIIQVGSAQPAGANALANRVISRIMQPFDLDGHQVNIGTSIGIALAPLHGDNPDTLLQHADLALYQAKADGRNCPRVYDRAMVTETEARRKLEDDLRRAVGNDEFQLYYQPIFAPERNRISGFEALLRWNHPRRGRVPPSEFIPIAEETGLIVRIGAWVMARACHDAQAWPEEVRVAVNVSAVQLRDPGFEPMLVAALKQSGLAPSRLELEITESVLLHHTESTLALLHRLKLLGVRTALDDFGTGYSSLSYLRRFPFDKIKIDQSFCRDVDDNEDALAIIRGVGGMAKALGIATVVEGVETEAQMNVVMAVCGGEIQGYLISPPQPASEVPRLLALRFAFGAHGVRATPRRRPPSPPVLRIYDPPQALPPPEAAAVRDAPTPGLAGQA